MLMQAGYHINEKLYESHNPQVYRAVREADNDPVVLKMLREAYPPPERIVWFKQASSVHTDERIRRFVQKLGPVTILTMLYAPANSKSIMREFVRCSGDLSIVGG